MSVGILLVTHPGIGAAVLHTVTRILGQLPLPTQCLEVPPGAQPDVLLAQAEDSAGHLDTGDGVLVLTDIYGATPSNVACRLASRQGIAVVSGLSLPMLIRVYNYADRDLQALRDSAAEGGVRGIRIMPQ